MIITYKQAPLDGARLTNCPHEKLQPRFNVETDNSVIIKVGCAWCEWCDHHEETNYANNTVECSFN